MSHPSESGPSESGKPILLAEDEEHIAKLVAFKLLREGFEVVVAKDGQEAMDLLASRPWGLLILDVMMPACDGWAVLRHARSVPGLSGVPVLMLTAKNHHEDRANASALGATQFLQKPFDPAALATLVKKLAGPDHP